MQHTTVNYNLTDKAQFNTLQLVVGGVRGARTAEREREEGDAEDSGCSSI